MADTNTVTQKQYLDKTGLTTFLNLINAQWLKDDDKVKTGLIGTDASSSGTSTILGLKYHLENGPIKDNATQISTITTQLIPALNTEDAAIRKDFADADTAIRKDFADADTAIRKDFADADTALDARIDALEAGATNPAWLSNTWLDLNIDGKTIISTQGTEKEVTLPDGKTKVKFTPKVIEANITLAKENNQIKLKSKTGEVELGAVDLSQIVLDRVLSAGAVVYDEKDIQNGVDPDPAAKNTGFSHPAFPYIVFTIDTKQEGASLSTKDYIRVSVSDLVDEYSGTANEITVSTTAVDGTKPTRTISIAEGFKNRMAAVERFVGTDYPADKAALETWQTNHVKDFNDHVKEFNDHVTDYGTHKTESAAAFAKINEDLGKKLDTATYNTDKATIDKSINTLNAQYAAIGSISDADITAVCNAKFGTTNA